MPLKRRLALVPLIQNPRMARNKDSRVMRAAAFCLGKLHGAARSLINRSEASPTAPGDRRCSVPPGKAVPYTTTIGIVSFVRRAKQMVIRFAEFVVDCRR